VKGRKGSFEKQPSFSKRKKVIVKRRINNTLLRKEGDVRKD